MKDRKLQHYPHQVNVNSIPLLLGGKITTTQTPHTHQQAVWQFNQSTEVVESRCGSFKDIYSIQVDPSLIQPWLQGTCTFSCRKDNKRGSLCNWNDKISEYQNIGIKKRNTQRIKQILYDLLRTFLNVSMPLGNLLRVLSLL